MGKEASAEKVVREIQRRTRRRCSAEEKIRIVLEGLRGEESIATLCRREGLAPNLYYRWSKEFLEAGKKRTLGEAPGGGHYAYNRTDLPWPFADRDAVLRSWTVVVTPGREIEKHFETVTDPDRLMGSVDGVVRMPFMRGHYKLEYIDGQQTTVEYQVNADPGGLIPTWLAARASRDLPLETLRNLRTEVASRRRRRINGDERSTAP